MRPRAPRLLVAALALVLLPTVQPSTSSSPNDPAPLALWGEALPASMLAALARAAGAAGVAGTAISHPSDRDAAVAAVGDGRAAAGVGDLPLPPATLAAAGLMQLPVLGLAVVPCINLVVDGSGSGGLQPPPPPPGNATVGSSPLLLTFPALAAMYDGTALYWDHPVIGDANPGWVLPHAPIVVLGLSVSTTYQP